jgi:hypothetical protein
MFRQGASKRGNRIIEGKAMTETFTLVFEGDLRSFGGNPYKTDTPFGRPIASCIGNAFDEIDDALRTARNEALAEAAAIAAAQTRRPRLGWARPEGSTLEEMRENVRKTDLYQMGDTVLVWVNEGDLWMVNLDMPLPPPQRVSDEHPTGEDAVAAEGRSPASVVGRKPETPEHLLSKFERQCFWMGLAFEALKPHQNEPALAPGPAIAVANALRTSRNEALEDAAKAARGYSRNAPPGFSDEVNAAENIATAICALKEPTP